MIMKVALCSKVPALRRPTLRACAFLTEGQVRSLRRGKNGALRLTSP
jgi:hypothetical protein